MKALAISLKDTKTLLRDRKALLVLIGMPLIIISILGLALGNIWSGDAAINRFDVGVVDQDHGAVSKAFINDILESKDMKKLLNVRILPEDEARRLVANGDLSVAVVIPAWFSADVNAGQRAKLKVLADPGQPLRAGIMRSVTDSFANYVSSVIIGTKTPITAMVHNGLLPLADVDRVAGALATEARQAQVAPQVTVAKAETSAEKNVGALQYYSAGMGVMFILFGSMFGAFSLLEERRQITLARMLATPTSRASILGGKLGGVFLIGSLQFAVLVGATRLLYGVDWGNSILGVIALAASTILAATGMAVFIAAIAKTTRSAAAMSQIMIQGMAALGGSMIPLMSMPPALQNVSRFTVNYWAISGFNDLMLNKGLESITLNCIILLAIAAVFLTLGVWRFRYE